LAYEVELIEDGNFVRLTLWGVLTRTDHEEFRAKARSALAETGWAKVLIDTTGADPEMSLTDDFKFTSGHQSQLPPNLRTAIVQSPLYTNQHPRAGRYHHYESDE
jgi:hypothetical protein